MVEKGWSRMGDIVRLDAELQCIVIVANRLGGLKARGWDKFRLHSVSMIAISGRLKVRRLVNRS